MAEDIAGILRDIRDGIRDLSPGRLRGALANTAPTTPGGQQLGAAPGADDERQEPYRLPQRFVDQRHTENVGHTMGRLGIPVVGELAELSRGFRGVAEAMHRAFNSKTDRGASGHPPAEPRTTKWTGALAPPAVQRPPSLGNYGAFAPPPPPAKELPVFGNQSPFAFPLRIPYPTQQDNPNERAMRHVEGERHKPTIPQLAGATRSWLDQRQPAPAPRLTSGRDSIPDIPAPLIQANLESARQQAEAVRELKEAVAGINRKEEGGTEDEEVHKTGGEDTPEEENIHDVAHQQAEIARESLTVLTEIRDRLERLAASEEEVAGDMKTVKEALEKK